MKARFIIGIVLILAMAAPALAAVDVSYQKWMSNEVVTEDINDVELVVGERYTFTYPDGDNTTVWRIISPDGGVTVLEGQTVSYVFQQEGTYIISVGNETYEKEVAPGPLGAFLALIGAGLAIGASGMGAAIGVGIAGASGAAAVAEKKENFSRALIFAAFPQTQAIYGLLVAILILYGTGAIGTSLALSNDIPLSQGLMALGAGLSVGIAGLSAIGQGIAAGTGVSITVSNPKNFGKGVIFSVLPETQAIYGLLVAIFLLYGSGIISGGTTPLMTMAGAVGIGLAGVGVGIGMGISGITAIGQGIAASAGAAASAEKPEIFSRGIIMAVLPETQSIYALLVSILVLNALGVLTVTAPETYTAYQLVLVGLGAIGAGFAIGIAGVSGIGQGITAGAGVSATSRNPQAFTSSLILAVMSETFAIFGLLISIFILIAMGVL